MRAWRRRCDDLAAARHALPRRLILVDAGAHAPMREMMTSPRNAPRRSGSRRSLRNGRARRPSSPSCHRLPRRVTASPPPNKPKHPLQICSPRLQRVCIEEHSSESRERKRRAGPDPPTHTHAALCGHCEGRRVWTDTGTGGGAAAGTGLVSSAERCPDVIALRTTYCRV